MTNTAHIPRDDKPHATLCGHDWEPWQATGPEQETDHQLCPACRTIAQHATLNREATAYRQHILHSTDSPVHTPRRTHEENPHDRPGVRRRDVPVVLFLAAAGWNLAAFAAGEQRVGSLLVTVTAMGVVVTRLAGDRGAEVVWLLLMVVVSLSAAVGVLV